MRLGSYARRYCHSLPYLATLTGQSTMVKCTPSVVARVLGRFVGGHASATMSVHLAYDNVEEGREGDIVTAGKATLSSRGEGNVV